MGKWAVLQSSQAAGDKEYLFLHHSSPATRPPKCLFLLQKRGKEQSKISHAAVEVHGESPSCMWSAPNSKRTWQN